MEHVRNRSVFWPITVPLCLGFLAAFTLPAPGWAQFPSPVPAGIATSTEDEVWIGVMATSVPDVLRAHLEIPENQGLLVASVAQGSPAEKAGIKQHDILLEAAGKPLTTVNDLIAVVREHSGKAFEIKLLRKGKTETVSVIPARRPAGQWELPLPFPGAFTDAKSWEKWLESLSKQFPGQSPFVFRFYHPGIVIPPGQSKDIPKNMTIVITKEGSKPAKIVVQKDDQKWEITENELDKLPADVRPHVENMLRGSAGAAGAVGGVVGPFGKELPKETLRFWRVPTGDEGERLKKLENQLKEMEKRLKELEEKLQKGVAQGTSQT